MNLVYNQRVRLVASILRPDSDPKGCRAIPGVVTHNLRWAAAHAPEVRSADCITGGEPMP